MSCLNPLSRADKALRNANVDPQTGALNTHEVKKGCCQASTVLKVMAAFGAVVLALGIIALLAVVLPQAGALTGLFSAIHGGLTTAATAMGIDALSLAILGLSVGGGFVIGSGLSLCSLKDKSDEKTVDPKALQNPPGNGTPAANPNPPVNQGGAPQGNPADQTQGGAPQGNPPVNQGGPANTVSSPAKPQQKPVDPDHEDSLKKNGSAPVQNNNNNNNNNNNVSNSRKEEQK